MCSEVGVGRLVALSEEEMGEFVPEPKVDFDLDTVMQRVAVAIAPFPKAALFELAERGFATPFEQLLACIISIRTRDEVTLQVAERLFQQAHIPQAIADLPVETLDDLIRPSTFHTAKAYQFKAIAQIILQEHGGRLPCSFDTLTGFKGVGPKCANLVLAIACGQPSISVDVHVHRITNRWGYLHTATPEQSLRVLEEKLPQRYWVEINRLLVPFGKHICTGKRPHCSTCPVRPMCAQKNVTDPR
jgi:endonuclease-3